jgi:hypothetical protein
MDAEGYQPLIDALNAGSRLALTHKVIEDLPDGSTRFQATHNGSGEPYSYTVPTVIVRQALQYARTHPGWVL